VGDQSALVRQWTLLKLLDLRNGGKTVGQLAAELQVSDKTVRRDLLSLRTVGFPIDETRSEYGRKTYRLDPACGPPGLSFTFDEALALYLGRRFLQPLAGTLVWQASERAFMKIKGSLGAKVLRYLDRVGDAIGETSFGASDYSTHADILDSLLIGIEDRKVVWITYQSQRATEPVTYDVHPYRILRHTGSLYLIGLKTYDEELRTWRVDRIEAVTVDPTRFAMPQRIDLDAHFANSFGIYDGGESCTVQVKIAPARARWVKEKRWHPSQQIKPHRDGSLTIQFRVSSTVELKSWLLSLGRDAQVLQPDSLRQEITQELETQLKIYQHPTHKN
jgi:predicted DNA-binding transcriptional regulator YafY